MTLLAAQADELIQQVVELDALTDEELVMLRKLVRLAATYGTAIRAGDAEPTSEIFAKDRT